MFFFFDAVEKLVQFYIVLFEFFSAISMNTAVALVVTLVVKRKFKVLLIQLFS